MEKSQWLVRGLCFALLCRPAPCPPCLRVPLNSQYAASSPASASLRALAQTRLELPHFQSRSLARQPALRSRLGLLAFRAKSSTYDIRLIGDLHIMASLRVRHATTFRRGGALLYRRRPQSRRWMALCRGRRRRGLSFVALKYFKLISIAPIIKCNNRAVPMIYWASFPRQPNLNQDIWNSHANVNLAPALVSPLHSFVLTNNSTTATCGGGSNNFITPARLLIKPC
jgi:hypothetical protein